VKAGRPSSNAKAASIAARPMAMWVKPLPDAAARSSEACLLSISVSPEVMISA